MKHPLLNVEDVTKTYDGFKAISNLHFYLFEGELRTVIGPNGAGKSTFFDLITGRANPDSGTIVFGHDTDLTALNEPQINRLGIGWGGTLGEMVNQFPIANYPDMTVISIMGGLTHGAEFNTFNIVSEMAKRLGARCEYLAAPIYASSQQSRDTILQQDVFRRAFEEIEKADIVVVSVGDATEQSLLISGGLPADVTVKDVQAAGAVADICGHFLDETGVELDHPLNRRAITLSLEALRNIPMRVVAAGGAHKVHALAAVLKSGLISALISDEDTARRAAALARA